MVDILIKKLSKYRQRDLACLGNSFYIRAVQFCTPEVMAVNTAVDIPVDAVNGNAHEVVGNCNQM